MAKKDININKAILHVLDTNVVVPVLSNGLLNTNETVTDFLQKLINKAFNDAGVKRTSFRSDSPFKTYISDYQANPTELVRISQTIAQQFFDLMVENLTIPSGDLVFVDFDFAAEHFLGILKLNYTQSYIHFANGGSSPINEIIVQPCTLPLRLDEFVLINLTPGAVDPVLLKEKMYTIDNEKCFYLSNLILMCNYVLSEKEAFTIIDETVKNLIKKECNNDYEKANIAKTVFVDDYITDGSLDVDNIADVVFDGDTKLQQQFKSSIEQQGLFDKQVKIASSIENKICSKQKYITDTGIEILIPTDQLKRDDVIEFVNNSDGTISVAIKSISLLSQK